MKNLLMAIFMFSIITVSLISSTAYAQIEGEALVVRMLNQDPDPAIAGDTIEVRFAVENFGDTSTGYYVMEVVPQYPFESVSGEDVVKDIGPIAANVAGDNMKIVKFKIKVNKDATAGSYNIKVLSYEKDKRESALTGLFAVDIESKESAEVIYIDQVELIPGKITPMKFTVNNVGSTPLRDLTFQWENEDDIILPVGSDNTKYIKYIDVGESAELTFNVLASATATPDLYKLDLTLTYYDPITAADKDISTKAGVYVGGATDFDVAFSGTSSGESSFSISNIGSVAASSVTVKIPEQQGWRVTGTNSVIIGNLNEGDYTIASFMLQQSTSGAAMSRNLTGRPARTSDTDAPTMPLQNTGTQSSSVKVDIVYTDSRGNRNTITKEVPVSLSSSVLLTAGSGTVQGINGNAGFRRQQINPLQSLWQRGKWFLLAAIVLLCFGLVRGKYKKGRLDNPDYTYKQAVKELFRKKKKKQSGR
ncbi:MAG: COG1361 S-layer family protein [Nanoarchaeota archaeon]|nr:COG1361 S-layer family protein [Nanoarchaeota archaeon]